MPDRYAYSSPFSNSEENSWFKLGNLSIDGTTLITILSVIGVFWNAVESSFTKNSYYSYLAFDSSQVINGQIWRIVTWPLYIDFRDFLWFLSIIFFYMLGKQLESLFGKNKFLAFTAIVATVPATTISLLSIISSNFNTSISGLSMINLAFIIVFGLMYPRTKIFSQIPYWVVAVILTGITLVSSLQQGLGRTAFVLVLTMTTLIYIYSIGLADENIKSFISSKRSKNSQPNLTVVENPIDEIEMDRILDKISEEGMQSLNSSEKKKLKNYSKQMKKKN